jgi:tetratricopeptide (TPR) repeat protein
MKQLNHYSNKEQYALSKEISKIFFSLLNRVNIASTSFLILFGLLCFSNKLFAQKEYKRLERANALFEDYSYIQAITEYEKLLQKNNIPEAQLKLAECYRLTKQMDNAETQYRKAAENSVVDSVYLYHFASVLKYNSKYEEAKEWYLKYEAYKQDGKGLKQAKFLDLIYYFTRDSSKVDIKNMAFNSQYADFSPTFFKDGLLFSSTRTKGKNTGGLDQWTGENFNDIYYIAKVNIDSASKAQLLHGFINSNFHEGPATYDANNNIIYFTRNSVMKGVQKRSKEGVLKIQIYTAAMQDNRWDVIKEFSLNNPENIFCHPSINADGSRIYFASDIAGGFGGLDIYYADKTGDGWGSPVNLGSYVNSQWNEAFPYIHSTGTLYFASEGLPGLGGFDVYSVRYGGSEWEDVKNLGYPINTANDDFGFILDSTNKSGYIASNRKGGKGSDDIYSVFIKDTYFEEGVLLSLDEDSLQQDSAILVNDFDDFEEETTVDAETEPDSIAGLALTPMSNDIEEALAQKMFKPDYSQEDELAKKVFKTDSQIKADAVAAEKEANKKAVESTSANNTNNSQKDDATTSNIANNDKGTSTDNTNKKAASPVVASQLKNMKDSKGRIVLEKAPTTIKEKSVEGLTYRIQVGAYSQPLKKSPDVFFRTEGIETYSMNDAITRYVTTPTFKNVKLAEQHKKQLVAKGLKDAWIVPFFKGKRISVEEAIEMVNK